MYSSIKTTVKVVVTTEARGDSSDQELFVSTTLLSTQDRVSVLCISNCDDVLHPCPKTLL